MADIPNLLMQHLSTPPKAPTRWIVRDGLNCRLQKGSPVTLQTVITGNTAQFAGRVAQIRGFYKNYILYRIVNERKTAVFDVYITLTPMLLPPKLQTLHRSLYHLLPAGPLLPLQPPEGALKAAMRWNSAHIERSKSSSLAQHLLESNTRLESQGGLTSSRKFPSFSPKGVAERGALHRHEQYEQCFSLVELAPSPQHPKSRSKPASPVPQTFSDQV